MAHSVMDAKLHATLQFSAEPVFVSTVQALPSLQSVGQSPSQVSPSSTTSLPHDAEQSLSMVESQPSGQQPSSIVHSLIGWCAQATLQVSALPFFVSMVQALPSLQSAGQSPSQVSPSSTTPLPQETEQSLSLLAVQPVGQQPSSSAQSTMA